MAAEITVTIEVRAGYEKVAGVSTTRDIVGIPPAMYVDLEPSAFRILQDALAPQVADAVSDVTQQLVSRTAEAEDRMQERAL